jgi:hypothetical protein
MTSKCYFNQKEALTSYERTEDGGLMIHGVVIMAAGSWTDMHGIHTVFSSEVLQRCADQWADPAVWTRHSGGTPRSITEKIGSVINPNYSPSLAAVVGDVLLHCKTETSAAAAQLVQLQKDQGGIKDVSAETIVEMDRDGNVTDVTFTGLALVEDGACEVCKLPAYGRGEPMAEDIEKKENEVSEGEGEQPEPQADPEDLLKMLAGFIEKLIPETKDFIGEVLAAEGEDRIRALGKLEGCMAAWGIAPVDEYAKAVDEKLATFQKQLDDTLQAFTQAQAQFSAPSGLKGKMGAEKEIAAERQTATYYGGRGRTALY